MFVESCSASVLSGQYDTPHVARAIDVAATTINAWRQRHSLFGGGSGSRRARYMHSFSEVCVAALIGDLTRHGLPLTDAIAIATGHQEAFIALAQNPEAERALYLHRELGDDPMITTDEPDAAAIVTKVDLRRVLNDVIRGLQSRASPDLI
jgi:transposase-like protein